MFPAILLAHWKIGKLNRQQLHRRDLNTTSQANLPQDIRLFITDQIAAARHLWSPEYPFATFDWEISKIAHVSEDGVSKVLIQIVISVVFP